MERKNPQSFGHHMTLFASLIEREVPVIKKDDAACWGILAGGR